MQAGAGIELHAKPGDTVTEGQPLLTLHTDTPERFAYALQAVAGSYDIAGHGLPGHAGGAGTYRLTCARGRRPFMSRPGPERDRWTRTGPVRHAGDR
ncbi:hypothetical protein SCANM63S_07488 [Streptomyces canarius]